MSSGEPVLPGRPGRPTQPAHWSVDELIPFGKYILLNKISAGKLVGTLTVNYTGTQATVTYALASGAVMTEAHLYAGDNKPTTVAPGQYGNTAYFATAATSHTFTVPVSASNGDGVWLIAHAVVCRA